jgi:hypothetical protein
MQVKEPINRSESDAGRAKRIPSAHGPGREGRRPALSRSGGVGASRAPGGGRTGPRGRVEVRPPLTHTEGEKGRFAGEMRVNTGGDPGRDDYSLPPVDIEVPDDARELDRDVHAYHRELRSHRRRMLAKKVYGPLASDGMVLPLLAGCLALTLLAATLLTVFTVGRGTVGGPVAHAHAPAAMSPPQGEVGGRLPDAVALVDGQPKHLTAITGPGNDVVVLALIPPGCGQAAHATCLQDLRELTREALQGHAKPYLVSTREEMTLLSAQVGLGGSHTVQADGRPLPAFYTNRTTLTAVLVRRDGSIAKLVQDRGGGFQIIAQLQSLVSPYLKPQPGGK